MVKKNRKKSKHALVVYHHELNSSELVTSILMHVLGYDMTQAANCAHIIYNMGQYVVKTYESDELNTADSILALLEDQNIPAELIKI